MFEMIYDIAHYGSQHCVGGVLLSLDYIPLNLSNM